MGLFDSVMVKCPVCGADVEFQSKAGDCSMSTYTLDAVPNAIAGDLIGESETCAAGHVVTMRGHTALWPTASGGAQT